jgi:hypothetical protein
LNLIAREHLGDLDTRNNLLRGPLLFDLYEGAGTEIMLSFWRRKGVAH